MIIWLLGLAYVIWFGSFRKPVALNPWLWASVGTLAYVVSGLVFYFAILVVVVLPISRLYGPETNFGIVVAIVQVATTLLAGFTATRIHAPMASRFGNAARLQELGPAPLHPAKDQLRCEECHKVFPSRHWLQVVEGRCLCAECQEAGA